MTKNVLQGSLLFFLCFATLNTLAHQKCPFPSISAKPFFAGYPDRDSLSNETTSEATALLKRAAPGQKLFLDYVHAASDTGQIYCLQPVPFYISELSTSVTRGGITWCGEISNTGADFSEEIKKLFRNLEPGHVFLIDDVYIRNKAGQTYCLDAIKMTVR